MLKIPGSPEGFAPHAPTFHGRDLGKDVRTLRFANRLPACWLPNWHFDETNAILYRQPGWFIGWLKVCALLAGLAFPFDITKDRRLTLVMLWRVVCAWH